jgi:manganese/zinc/iron transport system substrate-binding protein
MIGPLLVTFRILTAFRLRAVAIAAAMVFGIVLGASPSGAAERLDIVTTTGMIADAVRAVAGEGAEVQNLMGEGIDPHTYRQTRSDVVRLGQADMVFYNGLYLEAQLDELLGRLGERQPVVAVAEALPADKLIEAVEFGGRYDPHVWMDTRLWADVVTIVRDALSDHHPQGRATHEANAESYIAELLKLDAYARAVLETVPEDARVLVTAHDAFGYFGRAYDFEVVGIQGLSTESEAGLRDIEDIVAMIVERGIGAVFIESSVPERNVRALIEGARARGHDVVIGGELFSDAMGRAGTYEGTYIGMIDHNLTTIARALGGAAPEAGMHGRLGRQDVTQ